MSPPGGTTRSAETSSNAFAQTLHGLGRRHSLPREIGVRRALGAPRTQILREVLAEVVPLPLAVGEFWNINLPHPVGADGIARPCHLSARRHQHRGRARRP